jgi:hypothetical protein
MNTDYPWNGKVSLKVRSKNSEEVVLKLRIPGWARNEVLPGDLYYYDNPVDMDTKVKVNGTDTGFKAVKGYIVENGDWGNGRTIDIEFPTQVRLVRTNEKVKENENKAALEYGPLVYAIEEADNPDFDEIKIDRNGSFGVEKREDLSGGVNTIISGSLTAVPYYSWSNRGVGKMKVWMELK